MILQNHMTSQSFIRHYRRIYPLKSLFCSMLMFVHILLMPTSLKKSQSLLTYSVGMIQHELLCLQKSVFALLLDKTTQVALALSSTWHSLLTSILTLKNIPKNPTPPRVKCLSPRGVISLFNNDRDRS